MRLTKEQSETMDRWLSENIDGGQSVVWATSELAVILGIGKPPLPWDVLHPLAGLVRRRCAALGLEVRETRGDFDGSPVTEGKARTVRCASCGKQFESRRTNATRCPRCRHGGKRAVWQVDRACAHCGATFVPKAWNTWYCSPECRVEARRIREREAYETRKADEGERKVDYGRRKCALCGEWFEKNAPNASYCSERCRRDARNRQKRDSRRRRIGGTI